MPNAFVCPRRAVELGESLEHKADEERLRERDGAGMRREPRDAAVRSESSSSWLPGRTTGRGPGSTGEPRGTGRAEAPGHGASQHPGKHGAAGIPGWNEALPVPAATWDGTGPHPGSLPTGTPAAGTTLRTEPPTIPEKPGAPPGCGDAGKA